MSQFKTSVKTVIGAILLTAVCNGVLAFLFLREGGFTLPVILAVAASILALWRSKVSWTTSITWLFLSVLLTLDSNLTNIVISASEHAHSRLTWIMAFNSLFLATILLTFFRPPYVNARSSLIDNGQRKKVNLGASLDFGDHESAVTIQEISPRGALIQPNAELNLEVGQRFTVRVPEIHGLTIKARVVYKKDSRYGIQFRGWTLRSALEQSKLLTWFATSKAPKILASQQGFTLAEAVFVSAISGTVILAMSSMILDLGKANRLSEVQNQLQSLRSEFTQIMRNQTAWQNTVNDSGNTALACVRLRTACLNKDFAAINLRNIDNTLRLRSLTPDAGFSKSGGACTGFNAAEGSDDCPIRFVIQARPLCDDDCVNPMIELRLVAQFKPRSRMLELKESRFNAVVYRDPLIDSLATNCSSMGGAFESLDGSCNLNLLSQTCRTQGQYLAGVVDGDPVCRNLTASAQCPRGTYLRGFSTNGEIQCVAL